MSSSLGKVNSMCKGPESRERYIWELQEVQGDWMVERRAGCEGSGMKG